MQSLECMNLEDCSKKIDVFSLAVKFSKLCLQYFYAASKHTEKSV